MSKSSIMEINVQGKPPQSQTDSVTTGRVPSLQHLLDVISSIIAEEYIATAKQNPDIFLKQGDTK